MRVVAAIAGAALILAAWHSVLQTVFVPRYRSSLVARWTTRLVMAAVSGGARALPHGWRERLFWLSAPLALFVIASCWLVAGLAGFALLGSGLTDMAWSARGLTDFFLLRLASGPEGVASLLLGAGAVLSTALVLGAFITHLVRVTEAYSRRERMVIRLAAQATRPPDAEIMLASYLRTGTRDHLGTMLGQWAGWMADLEGTHQAYPSLVYYRQAGGLCWVKATVIMLDCAALIRACAPDWAPPDTGVLLTVGCRCLQGIAGQMGISLPRVPVSFHGRETAPFKGAIAKVREVGLPLDVSEESAHAEFHRLRIQYAPFANAVAERLHCDLAPEEGASHGGNQR